MGPNKCFVNLWSHILFFFPLFVAVFLCGSMFHHLTWQNLNLNYRHIESPCVAGSPFNSFLWTKNCTQGRQEEPPHTLPPPKPFLYWRSNQHGILLQSSLFFDYQLPGKNQDALGSQLQKIKFLAGHRGPGDLDSCAKVLILSSSTTLFFSAAANVK